jgi:hypothetical protein
LRAGKTEEKIKKEGRLISDGVGLSGHSLVLKWRSQPIALPSKKTIRNHDRFFSDGQWQEFGAGYN